MTATINDDLLVDAYPLPANPSVAVIAEQKLGDLALVALIERFGYRARIVDLDAMENDPAHVAAVLVRSEGNLEKVQRGNAFLDARIISLGVRVDDPRGIELLDSPYAAGTLEQTLSSVVGGVRTEGRVHLSGRELEVVVTYTLGATVRDTATKYFISESTVRSHLRRVMRRYSEADRTVSNKAQLLLERMADGWVERSQLMTR
ncbi:helix-turn-helix transcriptional regulator [Gordonia sp. 852002-51296_SCH5728562-b]|uniref:helix-turn-helix transcriptional regulator n=1 Tax=Gordonia sp. 852002-51296_SCH5728562-b TaxID=1834101 RepID=UPI0007EA832A|nr:LuxR C-terminal-related transcriptional regulator [Gordonia sp. 852002-51296_SCH5728562-b]OBA33208.1 hypothetical protein A5766_11860 [Gordonia sp. 852002-51296_SCH5728562-b]